MALMSMTGFARVEGDCEGVSWFWEVRSVNGRGLDVRSRFPPGLDLLDAKVRAAVSKALKRGNVNVVLGMRKRTSGAEIKLNNDVLDQVAVALKAVRNKIDCEAPRADGLLTIKGVLEVADVEDEPDVLARRHEAMMTSFDDALNDLVAARAKEGAALAGVVSEHLSEIERLVSIVNTSDARKPETIKERLREQVSRLVDANSKIDGERLYQEAALLATRNDIEEELRRLEQHLVAARDLLKAEGPVGRQLDFLAQEFNREANTLCSKSNDGAVTQAGLALKVVIDQIREQVQNIE